MYTREQYVAGTEKASQDAANRVIQASDQRYGELLGDRDAWKQREREAAAQRDAALQREREATASALRLAETIAALRADITAIEKKAPKTIDDAIANRDEVNREILEHYKDFVKRIGEPPSDKVALYGTTSCSKSSILNALFGRKVADVGVTETTIGIREVGRYGRATIEDTQGINSQNDYLNAIILSHLTTVRYVILVFANDVDEISKICDLLAITKAKVIFLRAKCDASLGANNPDEPKPTLEDIRADDMKKIRVHQQRINYEGYYQVSALNVRRNQTEGTDLPVYDWDAFKRKLTELTALCEE
ncbi:hypothetical protein HDV00_000881 [Rhizophlyctis rosea]|nr:hypothetical protein HDV00_000881 [Rhizophlyctis rosea]